MSISSVSTSVYSAYTYQWKNQELQGATQNPQSPKQNVSVYNGMSTVSSMVELAKFAMESMGVGANERVTFSQIEKYKNELEQEFSDELNTVIKNSNIDPNATFTISLDNEGKITVGGSHEDKAAIQAYFNANPNIGKELQKDISDEGIDTSKGIQLTVQSDGSIIVPHSGQMPDTSVLEKSLQDALAGTNVTQSIQDVLKKSQTNLESPISFYLEGDALRVVGDEHSDLEKLLNEDPELAKSIKTLLEEEGVENNENVTFTLNSADSTTLTVKVKAEQTSTLSQEEAEKLQEFLANNGTGESMKNGFAALGIDPNISFSLSIVDGGIVVNSTHPDAEKLQVILNQDAELAKAYLQIDALAGLEGARKSMQVDSASMKKRIEMESMVAWWDQMGQSSIGAFTGGSLSTFSGVNSVV